jgi:ABC-type Fe3+/spermidine/putrescine transport system ATPase subunit
MSFLRICSLYKKFNGVVAVNRLNLEIHEGEFFTLLGPSGCGKTTTLRSVGGLEKPDDGEIYLRERCFVSGSRGVFVKPEKRDMGMVFQSYALWPHMTVFENVAYPLKLRRVKGAEVRKRVGEVLGLVGLAGFEDRPAPALSGGQQQRVALARALVFSPRVLLLDEPLSNLDAQLREGMRRELKALQRRLHITVLFVTHDQIEALSLSDRIGIMHAGQLEQVGTPEEVYYRPGTPFVRDFLGNTFILNARVVEARGTIVNVAISDVSDAAPVSIPVSAWHTAAHTGQEVVLAIRPEKIRLWSLVPEGAINLIPAPLEAVNFLGDRYEYTVKVAGQSRVVVLPAIERHDPGSRIFLELKAEGISVWPAAG